MNKSIYFNDYLFKVLILGNSGCGKSSLLKRYVDQTFEDTHLCTIGVDFKIKTIECNNKNIKFQIWDTAGQEKFKTIVSAYYRGSHGIILVYDVCDNISFKNLKYWLDEIKKCGDKEVISVLVGNKTDKDKREVSKLEASNFALMNGMKYIETSAKNDENISQVFKMLAHDLVQCRDSNIIDNKSANPLTSKSVPVKLNNNENNEIKQCAC